MNNVNVIGRLTKDVELRFVNKGKTAVANLTVAVANPYNKDKVSFLNCVGFNKSAEIIAEHFAKGDQIGITGYISTDSYENKEGRTIYTTNINIERFTFGAKKTTHIPQTSTQNTTDDITPVDDGDQPF